MGVTTGKNSLGALCLISGVFFVWDTLRRWEKPNRNMRLIAINLAMIAVGQWLLNLSSSATALICLIFGTAILVVGRVSIIRRNPSRIVWLLIAGALIMVPLNTAFDFSSGVFSAAGRDATLTGRTDLWESIRKMELHPIFGFGYESFWLGERLEHLWALHPWKPNQAHNGYFEAYLNVGIVGVSLVLVYVFATLLKLKARLRAEFTFSMLALTYLCSLLFYNYTEASLLKWHIHWYAFLVLAIGTASIRAAVREPVGSNVVTHARRAFARPSTPSVNVPRRRAR
jgi:O-antigen ligase